MAGFVVWVSFKASANESKVRYFEPPLSQRMPRFKFIDEIDWIKAADTGALKVEEEALFPESFLISESIDNILEYVLRDFIRSWFENISRDDDAFVVELKNELRLAVQRLSTRLEKIDVSNLLIFKLLPIITSHFNNFVVAEEIVKGKKKAVHDINLAVASNFKKGKLHPALKLKNLSYENDRKEYLQDSVNSILPYLISPEELTSAPVKILIKNIVTSCVVFPSLSMICESDFWNQIIVNNIGSVLKDRYQVKKFRSVLDTHSNENVTLKNDYSQNKLMKQLLNTKTTQQQFDKMLKKTSKSQSVVELKQLRYYTSLQLSKSVRATKKDPVLSDEVKTYNKRLQILKKSIDKRLEVLLNPSSMEYQSSTPFQPESLPKNSKLSLSLNDILTNPSSLTYFMEFMEQRSRTILLQFWLTVNGIRSPLEDLTEYGDADSDDEELIAMSLSLDLSQSDDVEQIFNAFFEEKLLKIDTINYSNVENFVKSENKALDAYVKARKSLLIIQEKVYGRMEKTDFVAFQESDLFLRLLATEDLFNDIQPDPPFASDEEEEVDALAHYDANPEADEVHEKVGDDVIKVVEDALNQIMSDEKISRLESDPPSRQLSSSSLINSIHSDDNKSSHESPTELQRELFGLETEPSLFDDMESSIFSNLDHNQKRNSRLFDDASDSEMDSSETASNFGTDGDNAFPSLDNKELQLAAPGDLNLEEEISKLTDEIERYEHQVSIIEPLLRKAEITNNIAELKILRKSKIGLEREIRQNELQKQQYIVQENDNSLFGKSRVRIQSYVPEDNFIYYIIEVQKLSSENNNIVTAGWIVPRRFSQFYKLNEYLKAKYPVTQDIPFPKRKVVLKFQQTSLVEERKNQLEAYLQELLKIPEVCSNRLFRSFLSSEVFAMELNNSLNMSTKMSRRAKVGSVANKFYSSLSSKVPLAAASNFAMGNRFFEGVPQGDGMSPESQKNTSLDPNTLTQQHDDAVNAMQRELNSFDEVGKIAFVKPICDLIISFFRLKNSNRWLRGRAILVVLQQILGSTIEKKVRDNLNFMFKTETKILDMVVLLRDKLWPDGKFRESGKPRSMIEKSSTANKSKILIEKFLVDSTSKIFGVSNSRFASSKIYSMLQNELILNDLLFSLYDAILEEIFPEIADTFQNSTI